MSRSQVDGRRERERLLEYQARLDCEEEANCCISKIKSDKEEHDKKAAALPKQSSNNDNNKCVHEETANDELPSEKSLYNESVTECDAEKSSS